MNFRILRTGTCHYTVKIYDGKRLVFYKSKLDGIEDARQLAVAKSKEYEKKYTAKPIDGG